MRVVINQVIKRRNIPAMIRFSLSRSLLSLYICKAIFLAFSGDAFAGDRETLELGLGFAGASLPHYRGSDQRRDYVAPFPYFRYDGERLKINREGSQFYLYHQSDFKVDLSLTFAPPVLSEDNRAREGMPDLNPVVELGPRAQFLLYESDGGMFQLRACLPFRMAVASDMNDTRYVGWNFSPYILLHMDHKWDADISFGPAWVDETYHDYIYEVRQAYVTADRPLYDAKGGYSGSRVTFSTGQRHGDYWLGLFARYDDLNGAVFEESPLVKKSSSFMAGAAFSTILYGVK
ncbi:MAG: MipA/OmpV family protein [bacterium]|nr:MipA/OmpV family protein [bacterium]